MHSIDDFVFDINFNFSQNELISITNSDESTPFPPEGFLLLLDESYLLLLGGSRLKLAGY